MARHILKCNSCKRYSMKDVCPLCNAPTASSSPAKYSPDDKYAELKREAKKEQYQKSGLI